MAIVEDAGRSLADREHQLETLERLSQRFGQSLSGALAAGTAGGKQLSGVLDGIGRTLATSLGRSAISSLGEALTTGLQGAFRSLSASSISASFGGEGFPFARGGVLAGGGVTPFARGGVVAAPTYFPLSGGAGLMGEAGAEAILPLARGPDGRLGVRSGAPAAAPSVTVNITTSDAESFRRSEAQVAAALARAVARGRRAS